MEGGTNVDDVDERVGVSGAVEAVDVVDAKEDGPRPRTFNIGLVVSADGPAVEGTATDLERWSTNPGISVTLAARKNNHIPGKTGIFSSGDRRNQLSPV